MDDLIPTGISEEEVIVTDYEPASIVSDSLFSDVGLTEKKPPYESGDDGFGEM